MLKLLKYELKSRKSILLLGGSLTIIILNILIMLDWKLGGNEIFGYDDTFGAIYP